MSTRRARFLLASAVLIAAAGSAVPGGAATGSTARISVSSGERQANGPTPATSVEDRTSPAMSLAGLHVAFSSDATNLVSGDTNAVADVFVRDLPGGRTIRVSVSSSERQANGPSHSPALSVDGRFVAFVSSASNLVSGDTNGFADIFVRDIKRGTTQRISVSSSERQANGPSSLPSVSLYGRWIGFESEATNIGGTDTNGMPDAFYRDRETGKTVRIAPPAIKQSEPKPNETVWTARPTIGYDGKWIAFQRLAARIVPASTSVPPEVTTIDRRFGRPGVMSSMDAYMLERRTGKLKKITLPAWPGSWAAYRNFVDNPVLSADGRYVVMEAWSVMDHENSNANNDLDDDGWVRNPLDHKDIWVYDRQNDSDFPVSRNSAGMMGNADSTTPQITAQGHAVAFMSDATNLAVGDTNNATDVFVWDSRERATSRVSVGDSYTQSGGAATRPSMSYEGRSIAFASAASDLATGDSNLVSDIFWHDRRLDIPNRPPSMGAEMAPVRTINMGEEHTFKLKARDPDGDPLRYGMLLFDPPDVRVGSAKVDPLLPTGVEVDPVGGIFRWTPRPDQSGPWIFVVWVDDPRGRIDYKIMRFVVRTAPQTAQCRMGHC